MSAADFERLREVVLHARELAGEARLAYLEGLADAALRREAESLLARDHAPAAIVETGALASGLGARLAEALEPIRTAPMPERIGSYAIREVLGEGGMGVVYRAEQTSPTARVVALKVARRGLEGGRASARFDAERSAVAMLSHPGIARLLDAGADEGGRLYFAMELVEGRPLHEYCDHHRLAIHERLALFLKACEAVHYAHGRGIVHRDLKPSNIVVTGGPAGATALKVIDFGIAKMLEQPARPDLTQQGHYLGTPEYMSPEQAGGDPDRVGPASDVYALGVVLYELLCGRRPHDLAGLAPFDALKAVRETEPEPPSAHCATGRPGADPAAAPARAGRAGPEADPLEAAGRARGVTPEMLQRQLAGDLDAIVLAALRKRPEERYASAEALGADIRCYLEGQPLSLRPSGTVGRRSATPTNLPAPQTSFVGRGSELADCARLLGEARLLTLTGVGGCGKTRLALQVAERQLDRFPDGVWFVDLASLQSPERVVPALADVLGVREEPGARLLDTVTRRLAAKRSLILLDNCEHVLEACAGAAHQLLGSAGDLRLLATSREGLGVEGERSYPVRPLSIPAVGEDLQAVEGSDAFRLFMERARAVAQGFAFGAADTPAVADICRRLDGIPLAIELAAARVKMLSLDQIRAKLDDRFRLLTGGARTALPRHQTLRATLSWSHDHLSPDEQRLFRLVAVFAGGWTLPAATALAGEPADEVEVLDLLTRIADKSLVVVDRDADGEPRYRMLETVRQYALERLHEAGETAAARTRHLDHFLRLVEEAKANLQGSGLAVWSGRLAREHENILTALARCDHGEQGAEKALRILVSVASNWSWMGRYRLTFDEMRRALDRPGAQEPTSLRASALRFAGTTAVHGGHVTEARPLLMESLAIAERNGEAKEIAVSLRALVLLASYEGDYLAARASGERAIAIARTRADHSTLPALLNDSGDVHRALGDHAAARSAYEESLALCRADDFPVGVAICLSNLCHSRVALGELPAASRNLHESLETARRIGSPDCMAAGLDAAAVLAAAGGEWERAVRLAGSATRRFAEMGRTRARPDEKEQATLRDQARAALGPDTYAAVWSGGESQSLESAVADTLEWLGASGSSA